MINVMFMRQATGRYREPPKIAFISRAKRLAAVKATMKRGLKVVAP
jgi:hypothetical protein